jgi:hypothetical protein
MTLWPMDPILKRAVGFKIYDPSGKEVAAGIANSDGQREATFASDVAGDYLILVYNYAEGVDLNYILEISN